VFERGDLGFFQRERANHPHARDARLHARAHLPEGGLVVARARVKLVRQAARDEQQQRERTERGERQLAGDRDGDGERAHEREHGVDDVQDAEAEQEPHLREIVRHAAHDFPGAHAPVKRGAEREQLLFERGAELVFGVPARVEDDDAREHPHDRGTEHHPDEHEAERDGARVLRPERVVDRGAEPRVEIVLRCLVRCEQNDAERVARAVAQELGAKTGRKAPGKLGHTAG